MFDKVLLSKSFRHTFKNTKVTYLVFFLWFVEQLVLSNLCVFANKSMTSCNETLVRNWPMVSADLGKKNQKSKIQITLACTAEFLKKSQIKNSFM